MRVPLPTDFAARLSSASKDARMINGLKETKYGEPVVLNRPGVFSTGYDYTSLQGVGVGFGGLLYAAYDDTFALNEILWYPGFGWLTGEGVWYGGEFWEAIADVPAGASAPTEGAYWTKVINVGNFFWDPDATYDYDDYAWEIDPATGRFRKAYARTPVANKQRPFQTGWRGTLWGTTPLATTDRWRYTGAGVWIGGGPPPSPVSIEGNSVEGCAGGWLSSAQLYNSYGGVEQYMDDPYTYPPPTVAVYVGLIGHSTIGAYYSVTPSKIA